MTLQKVSEHELVMKKDLTENELKERLETYFDNEEISKIINFVNSMNCWTDGNIAIIRYELNKESTFVIVANKNFIELIKP